MPDLNGSQCWTPRSAMWAPREESHRRALGANRLGWRTFNRDDNYTYPRSEARVKDEINGRGVPVYAALERRC